MDQPIAYQVRMKGNFERCVEAVIRALKDEGFGVLTEIDVQTTLKEKLDKDFRPYRILGACNPPLAYRALSADPVVGVMLPCNVTVEQVEGEVLISLANPVGMLTLGTLGDNPALKEIAQEANARIKQVASSLEAL